MLFASGAGSNVENIIRYFKNNASISVAGVFSNNPNAKALEKASKQQISTYLFQRNELSDGTVATIINEINPDLIVLAGFLLKFPASIISEYPNKIINIHPALLPKYGVKGMYGIQVHQAILDKNETTSGITIHYVNEHYDEGEFILQSTVNIENCETAEAIAEKIHELEYIHFPKEIEKLLAPK